MAMFSPGYNVKATAKVAFVVDDMASVDPWRPRAGMIQGRAEALDGEATSFPGADDGAIRIFPDKVAFWGLEDPAHRAST